MTAAGIYRVDTLGNVGTYQTIRHHISTAVLCLLCVTVMTVTIPQIPILYLLRKHQICIHGTREISAKLSCLLGCSETRFFLMIISRNAIPGLNCRKRSPLFDSPYAVSYLVWNTRRVLCLHSIVNRTAMKRKVTDKRLA